jgi:hypothetical protein
MRGKIPLKTKKRLEAKYDEIMKYFTLRVVQNTLTVALIEETLKEIEPIFNQIVPFRASSFSYKVGETKIHLEGLISILTR